MFDNNIDFNHLHVHTEYSRFDGLNKMSEMVLHARKMGFKSLAITDHGNVGGWMKFYQECKRKKDKKDQEIPYDTIKPILGEEFYLARDISARGKEQQPDGRKGNRHIVLLAKNEEGYKNLCTLSQKAFLNGQAFGDPRIDINLLAEYHKGIICTSACLGSVVNINLLTGRYDKAKAAATLFKDIFKEDFFLEVMYHGIDAEGEVVPEILKLGKELNIPIIATNDCHYCRKEQAKSQELLMAMSTSRCLKDPKRLHFPHEEFYMKSAKEMAQVFGSHPEVLLNTVALAERVEDFIKPGNMRMPEFNIAAAREIIRLFENNDDSAEGKKYLDEIYAGHLGKSVSKIKSNNEKAQKAYEFLCEQADLGMKRLGWDKSELHIIALKKELGDIKVAWDINKMDFSTYLLIVWSYVSYAKKKGILTGCGRGSGYASVLLRTLGICYGPCPIRYGLIWERFLCFDTQVFLLDSDWGIGDETDNALSVDDLITSDDLDEDRAVEFDEGGVDRY